MKKIRVKKPKAPKKPRTPRPRRKGPVYQETTMPQFDIQCVRCKQIKEVVITTYKDNFKRSCDICNCVTWWETQAPLTNMQPDNMWAGHMVHGKHITSKSFLNRYEKQNNLERVDRSILEEVKKKHDRRIPEAFDKNKKKLHDTIANEVKQLNLPND